MSDVLIKGMKMPKSCEECPCSLIFRKRGFEEEDIRCFFQLEYGSTTMDRCPLVEVKPHGRLIDADRLADDFYVQLVVTSPYMQKSTTDAMVETVRTASQMAPTVLEASE